MEKCSTCSLQSPSSASASSAGTAHLFTPPLRWCTNTESAPSPELASTYAASAVHAILGGEPDAVVTRPSRVFLVVLVRWSTIPGAEVLAGPVGSSPDHTAVAHRGRLTAEVAHSVYHACVRVPVADVLAYGVKLQDLHEASHVEPPVAAKRHAGYALRKLAGAVALRRRNGPDPLARLEGEGHDPLLLFLGVGDVEDSPRTVQGHVLHGADGAPFVVDDDPPGRGVDHEHLLGAPRRACPRRLPRRAASRHNGRQSSSLRTLSSACGSVVSPSLGDPGAGPTLSARG